MIIDSILGLKTDPRLLAAVHSASKRLSPQEIMEQRVSFVYGSMGHESNMTKEQVRRVILEQGGEPSRKK